jgi:Big-like domain-containing protein
MLRKLIFLIGALLFLNMELAISADTTLDLSAPLPNGYTWSTLNLGKKVYIDRGYIYKTIPTNYSGQNYIVTANNHKNSTGNAFLSFDVNVNVTVYVAHDIRIAPKPTWLGDWIDTGEALVTSDTTLSLFSKDFTAGTVTLGGNEGSGKSMYTVVVVPQNGVGDISSPTVPGNIAATVQSDSQIDMSWSASIDDVGVVGYRIFRDGLEIGTTSGLNFSDTGLSASTPYLYKIEAFDSAGNESAQSQGMSATTEATAPIVPPPSSFQPSPLPKGYSWGTLDVGKAVYIDRSYKYTTVPTNYSGQNYILTKNNDKLSTGNAFLNFDVNVNVTVYVAHDIRISPKPIWLGNWVDTGEVLKTSDTTLRLYSKGFTADSVTLGGNEGSGKSMYAVVVVPLNNTNGGNSSVPIANSDSISMEVNTSANINVLANDSGLADTPVTVSVVTAPNSGLAVRNADNTITYTPNSGFSGQDSFNYKVTDQDGDTGLTTVSIQVNCTSCTANKLITLSWKHSDPNSVDGYKIYAGPTAQNSIEVADISTMDLADPQTPLVDFLSYTDLGLNSGDTVCFRAQAYNAFGSSSFSTTVCTNI